MSDWMFRVNQQRHDELQEIKNMIAGAGCPYFVSGPKVVTDQDIDPYFGISVDEFVARGKEKAEKLGIDCTTSVDVGFMEDMCKQISVSGELGKESL